MLCVQCHCVKVASFFSKAQQKKADPTCRSCIDRGVDLPSRVEKPKPVYTEKTATFLDELKERQLFVYRNVSGTSLPRDKGPYKCTFCFLQTPVATQFGSNMLCPLCVEGCDVMNVPKDLTADEWAAIKKTIWQQRFDNAMKDVRKMEDLPLTMLALDIEEKMAIEDAKKEGVEQQKWLNQL
jgi:hypothetical protein